jgi:ATP-dependent exoDNAse (exonuclease V) beta subunit
MTGSARQDAGARRLILDALDSTLVVEAAAGTGKTTELINRMLRMLATGRAKMTQMVAVTFTEKAAGELKLRLRERLEKDRAETSDTLVRERLERALATLEEAHVNTIHGFCAELIRERPVEAHVDPLFTVLTEPQAERLYDRAFNVWLRQALHDAPEGVRRALRRTAAPVFAEKGSDGPIDRLRRAGRELAEWRDFPAPWRRPPFDRAGEIDRLIARLHRLADLTERPSSTRDNLFADTDGVRRLSRQIRLEQSFGQQDLDGWESRLVDLLRDRGFSRTRKGSGYTYRRDVARSTVLDARDELFRDLQQFRREADADLAAALQQELQGATEKYQELKAAAGALDFKDLLLLARDLIRGNAAVRRHLQGKFTHLFVDEFQDTDPVQAELLLLLASGDPDVTEWSAVTPVPGKLFIVGDPKQAIYRFRGADVATYWQVSRQIAERGGSVVQLTTSYRSVPDIQRFVNAAFSRAMIKDEASLQAGYTALSRDRPENPSQPAIVALPVPRPYSSRSTFLQPSAKAIDESLPDAVGAFIAWLVDARHGWTVGEPQADGSERQVAIQPKHIAVLFRRFVSFGQDVTRPYIDAIEARGIPHLLVGGKAFHGREEVEMIRAALAAIEWPDDELSVFATLKGPLFAIDDEHLLQFRHRFGAFHPFRVPKELGGNSGRELALTGEPTGQLMGIADGLRLLQQLHRGRNYRPAADTIGRLLAETRAHVGLVLRPAGEQALANVLHVAELARQYEAAGGISFRGFIDQMRGAADSEGAEAPILEESSDGVRVMTVHKAKGLEFPVVILADLTCKMSRNDASRHLDVAARQCALRIGGWAPHELHDHEPEEAARDEAEGVRLAYVAATRARDLLVVPALGDGPWEGGWFAPLNAALYPQVAARSTRSRGPACPAFTSRDSVLERPNDEPAGPSTVAPGLHTFPIGGYGVVWWDPGPGGGLVLGEKAPFGVRRSDLIVKDVPRQVVDEGRARYDRWRYTREQAREAGASPSVRLRTVREWSAGETAAASMVPDPAEIQVVMLAMSGRGEDRPGGAAFGTLVHAVLARAPFESGPADLVGLATLEARVLGLPQTMAEAAASVAEGVFGHEILRRAGAAAGRGRCRRETAVTYQLADGTLIEGVVDLAFEDEGTWWVVDYKTDRQIATGELQYRRQVALYAAAIARSTGAAATGVILRLTVSE